VEVAVFKIGIVMMAPDGDPDAHKVALRTARMEYILQIVEGGNIEQSVEACRRLAQEQQVHAIFLCPGFDYSAVARVKEAVGPDVAVSVTMADMANSKLAVRLLAKEGIVH
jgi:Family of unknown function (DUF6506)